MMFHWKVIQNNSFATCHVSFGLKRFSGDALGQNNRPLLGTASLEINHFANNTQTQIYLSSPQPHGFTKGTFYTQWNPDTDSEKVGAFGLYCLADRSDMTGGQGRAYLLGFDNQGGSYSTLISKTSNGTVYDSMRISGQQGWPLSDFWGMQWRASGDHTEIRILHGLTSDVGQASVFMSYRDTSGALSVAISEGFWAQTITAVNLKVFIDQTMIRANV